MQTFLPFPDFNLSAQALDKRRATKQLVECIQILNVLCGLSEGWKHHPAVRMWRGHEGALIEYASVVLDVCLSVHKIKFTEATINKVYAFAEIVSEDSWAMPTWLGDNNFHQSHQSNLNRKSDFYKFNVPTNLEYVWPK